MIQHTAAGRPLRESALICCLVLLAIVPQITLGSSSDLGLAVNSQGTLVRNGAPYRGIGVNYYDAFLRVLRNPSDDSYKQGFAALGSNGIPFARINAGSFLPSDVRFYLDNKEQFLQRLDGVVQAAEKAHVGLIPSLFWEPYAISDALNEPRSSWGDSGSQARKFMRQYTQDVVSRYVNSPAIWGWEFSCELSLAVDHRRPANPANALSYETFRNAALDFAQVVRRVDPNRILLTGNSLPRLNAYHDLNFGRNGVDTEEEFGQILLRDNPGPFSPICIHASPAQVGRYFADHPVNFQGLLDACAQIGQRVRKPIYVEEFIPVAKDPNQRALTSQRDYFAHELAAIENSRVPIASVWVYDRKLASDNIYNLTFDNERSYMLRMIADFDQSVHAQR
jgi:hypothetical protein